MFTAKVFELVSDSDLNYFTRRDSASTFFFIEKCKPSMAILVCQSFDLINNNNNKKLMIYID